MIREAMFFFQAEDQIVVCYLCHHRCHIAESKFGFCGVRQNREGKLYTHVYGEAVAAHVDPVEKKPLYHFLPGSTSFSIAASGCNFRCGFCQNWQISQLSFRDGAGPRGQELPPAEVVQKAKEYGCQSISYTYTEPTIFFEYAFDTARLAKDQGLGNIFVTNGYMTSDALMAIQPYLDACNVDLKFFREDSYQKVCRGHLEPVLESIRLMKKLGIWVEITTLVVPGQNDDEEQLTGIARFLAATDPDMPWHLSRFHPDYKFGDTPATPLSALQKATAIGREEGIRFIYVGNVPQESRDTFCPACGEWVIRRSGFGTETRMTGDSKCSSCGERIPGIFGGLGKISLPP
jgi:pyruvate formate lyase activating enzyme